MLVVYGYKHVAEKDTYMIDHLCHDGTSNTCYGIPFH